MSANLANLLARQALTRPSHPALVEPSKPPITFAALQTAVQQGAAYLRQSGLAVGDRVLVYQPISAELYIALGALFYAGITVVFIDPGMRGEQLERAATVLAPRGFLATPRAHLLRLISPAIRKIPVHFTTGTWPMPGARRWQQYATQPTTLAVGDLSADLAADSMADCEDDTPALITVTSGSTGTPKFATRTHGFLRRQHQAIDASLAMAEDTVVATTLPIFILSFLASGITTLLPQVDLRRPGQVKVEPLLAQMQAAGVNTLAASPAFVDLLARYGANQDAAKLSPALAHIRRVYSGGAPVFVDLMDQVRAAMPNAHFHAVYGATEAEPIATLEHNRITLDDREQMANGAGLLVGTPVESIAVRVIADQWGRAHGPYTPQQWDAIALAPGQSGEIVVNGPHVLTTVGPGEDATLTKIQVGEQIWHRTGDAGYWDTQARLWLLGRCAARLETPSTDGVTRAVYPFTVETAAHTFPAVKHAALVAQTNTSTPKHILAIELYAPQSEAWHAQFSARLAWANLDEIRVLKQMPVDKRHNAKIDYPALRKLIEQK